MTPHTDTGRERRNALLRHTGGELAEALADQCLGVFGSITPTDEQRKQLADELLMFAARWAVDEFKLHIIPPEEQKA